MWSVGFCGVGTCVFVKIKEGVGVGAGWRVECVDWSNGLECVWVVGGLHRGKGVEVGMLVGFGRKWSK